MATNFEIGHNDCRRRVCICCYRKAERSLSQTEVECIRTNLINGYSLEDPDFPNGICTGCHIELSKKENDQSYNLLPHVDDYDPKRERGLRSSATCECKICTVAKMQGLTYQRMYKKKGGRPKSTSEKPKSFKICSQCFDHIYRGSNHSAIKCQNSRRSKVYNIESLVREGGGGGSMGFSIKRIVLKHTTVCSHGRGAC